MKHKQPKLRNLKPRTIDAAVIAQIQKIRPHLSKPCPIRFFLYFPSEDAATKSAIELRDKDFIAEVSLSIGPLKWLCLALKNMIPETTVLVRLHEIMDDLASKYGGQYDGWEAEIADDSNDVA
ncbi:MAG: ribonuclease E inhibitor RraB [Ignavibacteriae bacterium]|nr:MAG: ribonuclease E inhibitor RraB [Ignavibacteriota bacterium]